MSSPAKHYYEFGPFRLEPAERRLSRGGEAVYVTPKAFETLLVLVERHGQLLSKDELLNRVWPDSFVEEATLARNISTLRQALDGNNGTCQYIETVTKQGYRFTASVTEHREEDLEAGRATLQANSVEAVESRPALHLEAKENAAGHVKVEREVSIQSVKDPRTISRRRTLAALAVIGLVTIGLGVMLYQLRWRTGHPTPPQGMKVSKISSGGAWGPTISPDGKYVAYVAKNTKGENGVWIKLVATGYATQLVAPTGIGYGVHGFSRDGNYLYYTVIDLNNSSEYFLSDVYRIPIVGGASRKIASAVGGLTVSPNGKQMALLRVVPSRQAHDLIICNDDGTDERVIATRHWPDISWSLTWSPDGRLITFGARNRDGDSFYNTIMAVPVEGGPDVPLTSHRWLDVHNAVWLGDGSGLLVSGKEQLTESFQIYFISYPSGEVSRVTNDTNSYSTLSITTDSRTLVAEMQDITSNIWVTPDGDASRARQITSGGKDGLGGLSWTPNGKIVYSSVSRDSFISSAASGNSSIWIINRDGSNPRQLMVDDGVDMNPVVTPDGQQVVFASHRGGAWGIWRADMDGGNSTLLVSGGTTTFPVCSPDGRWVYFRRLGSAGPPSIWRVPLEGGEALRLTGEHAYYPAVSPDGNWVAFFSPTDTKVRLLVIPSTGGEPVKTFDVWPETNYLIFTEIVRWTADGRFLTYIKNQRDTSNIWGQPFAGGAPRRLTNFDEERILSFAWSPDGKQLAVARGQHNHQIVLIENFR